MSYQTTPSWQQESPPNPTSNPHLQIQISPQIITLPIKSPLKSQQSSTNYITLTYCLQSQQSHNHSHIVSNHSNHTITHILFPITTITSPYKFPNHIHQERMTQTFPIYWISPILYNLGAIPPHAHTTTHYPICWLQSTKFVTSNNNNSFPFY